MARTGTIREIHIFIFDKFLDGELETMIYRGFRGNNGGYDEKYFSDRFLLKTNIPLILMVFLIAKEFQTAYF